MPGGHVSEAEGIENKAKKSSHLDRDTLSHPTASNVLKREENTVMPEYAQQ